MKYKNLAYWKRQCYYWKRRALEAEKSIISVQKVEQHVKLNDLPIEIIWNIMEYLDIESAFKIGEIGKFSKKQVFKYHYFSLQESTGDFPFFCEFIRNLIGDKEELLEALLVNKRFKEIVEMEKVLALAANFGYMNVLTKLLEKNVDPTDDENLCLRLAAQNGHTEIVKELLKNPNVDPATCANYPILFASRNGHTEIVEILLKDDRVDPSDVDNWAIKKAAYLGHVDVVVLLTKDHRVRNKSGFEKFWRRYLKRFVLRDCVKKIHKRMARPWTPLIKFRGPRSLLKQAPPAQKILSQVPERFKPLQLSVKEMEAVESGGASLMD